MQSSAIVKLHKNAENNLWSKFQIKKLHQKPKGLILINQEK